MDNKIAVDSAIEINEVTANHARDSPSRPLRSGGGINSAAVAAAIRSLVKISRVTRVQNVRLYIAA